MRIRITMKNGVQYVFHAEADNIAEYCNKWRGTMMNSTNPLWAIDENCIIALNEVMIVEGEEDENMGDGFKCRR